MTKRSESDENHGGPIDPKPESLYEGLEKRSLRYIRHQNRGIILSAIYPLMAGVIQIINLCFMLHAVLFGTPQMPPPENFPRPPPPQAGDMGVLSILLLMFCIIAIMKFVYIIRWRTLFRLYSEEKTDLDHGSSEDPDPRPSSDAIQMEKNPRSPPLTLTHLLYRSVQYYERIRVLFIALNGMFALYLMWFLLYFSRTWGLFPPPHPNDFILLHYLNLANQAALFFYIIGEWYHFLRGNRKLLRLTLFEQETYKDLNPF